MAKQAAYGTMLNWGDGGGTEAFAPVAYVTNIGGPGLALDTEDVTSHDQATAWEEVVPTILRSGEVSIDLVFDPADDTQDFTETLALGSQMEARGTATNFQIVFPDTTTWTFAANVTGWEPSAPVDGALTVAGKLKITGQPTLE
jgi:predicted secreted protein